MTRARRTAKGLRLTILILGIVYAAVAICWLISPYLPGRWQNAGLAGTPLGIADPDSPPQYLALLALFLGLLLLAQWAFLRPRQGRIEWLASPGRPLKSAVIVAGAMTMLLSVGLLALLLELPDWWTPIYELGGWWGAIGIWTAMALLWVGWAVVFYVYWRDGDHYTQLSKMVRALVAGSLLEAALAIPAHVLVMRQRDCYCARGTYTAMIFAGTVILWAFGPGIVLLYLREKYRRARLFRYCDKCGYNLTGNVSGICPECGRPIADETP